MVMTTTNKINRHIRFNKKIRKGITLREISNIASFVSNWNKLLKINDL